MPNLNLIAFLFCTIIALWIVFDGDPLLAVLCLLGACIQIPFITKWIFP